MLLQPRTLGAGTVVTDPPLHLQTETKTAAWSRRLVEEVWLHDLGARFLEEPWLAVGFLDPAAGYVEETLLPLNTDERCATQSARHTRLAHPHKWVKNRRRIAQLAECPEHQLRGLLRRMAGIFCQQFDPI